MTSKLSTLKPLVPNQAAQLGHQNLFGDPCSFVQVAISIPYPAPCQVWIDFEMMDSFFTSKCERSFLLHVFWGFVCWMWNVHSIFQSWSPSREKKQTLRVRRLEGV